jgi:hypothetical protein
LTKTHDDRYKENMKDAKELAEILLASTDSEATSHPFWAICRGKGIHLMLINGIWFDRISAEDELESRRWYYGDDAFVFCFSGCVSEQYKRVRELAEKIVSADEDPIVEVLERVVFEMLRAADSIGRHDLTGADRLRYVADQAVKVLEQDF